MRRLNFGKPRRDLTGQVFGNWRVIGFPNRQEMGNERSVYYWESECLNCGAIIRQAKTNLEFKKKHPGCRNCDMMPKGESGLNRVISYYRINAKNYGREFALSNEEFRRITSEPCHYCGADPEKVVACNKGSERKKSHWGDYTFNGIDRVDNERGYVPGNCVACCGVCNRAKNSMTYDEFVGYLKGLLERVSAGRVPFARAKGGQDARKVVPPPQ